MDNEELGQQKTDSKFGIEEYIKGIEESNLLYIEEIEKGNEAIHSANKIIVASSVVIGLAAIYAIIMATGGALFTSSNIGIPMGLIPLILTIISAIRHKTNIKVNNEIINKILANNAMLMENSTKILENESSMGRSL